MQDEVVMRQYTNESQTAKLIELGLKKPKSIIDVWAHETDIDMEYEYEYAYSIGELLSFLPRCIETPYDTAVLEISYDSDDGEWYCGHRWYYNRGWRLFGEDYRTIDDTELVDALYRYIVELKEEGVI